MVRVVASLATYGFKNIKARISKSVIAWCNWNLANILSHTPLIITFQIGHSGRKWFVQVLYVVNQDGYPYSLNFSFQISCSNYCIGTFSPLIFLIMMIRTIFYIISIWWLGWPHHSMNIVFIFAIKDNSCTMHWQMK